MDHGRRTPQSALGWYGGGEDDHLALARARGLAGLTPGAGC
jgi:hypothetical protein